MNLKFKHIPVMKKELLQSLNVKKKGIYIDSTFGMGGHSIEILKHLSIHGKLYALDKDPQSITEGKKIKDKRFEIIQSNFSKIWNIASEKNIIQQVNGVIFDLGMSSPQIENPERGFSFMKDGPLDMRMNPKKGISAADWLFKSSELQISSVLRKFGEERFSKKIAYAIKTYNIKKKIISTLELVHIIKKAVPIKSKFKHPATRTFQAIRIYINEELNELKKGLQQTLKIIKPGGRIVVISFHSLEDRIAKQFMIKNSQKANIPYGMPITEKKINRLRISALTIINRIFPTDQEVQNNPRSRSAILRTAEIKNINENTSSL